MSFTAKHLLSVEVKTKTSRHRVKELFFDPDTHALDRVAIDAGGWLSERDILVSAQRFEAPQEGVWPLALSQAELDDAPTWDDAPSLPTRLPPLIVGPFGYSISPMLIGAEFLDDEAEPNKATQFARRRDRAGDLMTREAYGPDGYLGRVDDLHLDDTLKLVAFEVDGTTMPLSRLRRVADQGHLIFD